MNIIRRRLDIHPSLGIEFLVVVCVAIELRPYGDHKASMHLMHIVEHLLGIGIARSLKLMTAPLVLGPVVPVLYDIIDGDMALTELCECTFNLVLCLVALTALPEAQHPFGIKAGLTRQGAIARDYLVKILAGNKVIVHILCHLTPHGEFATLLIATGLSHTQTTIGLTTIWLPLDTQLDTLLLLHRHLKLIGIGVPGCAPTLWHHFLAIDINLDVTAIIENKLIQFFQALTLAVAFTVTTTSITAFRFNEALVEHIGTCQLEAFGEILDTPIIGFQCYLRLRRCTIFIIYGIFITHQFPACTINVCTCEVSLVTLFVIETESAVQL